MDHLSHIAREALKLLQAEVLSYGFKPAIHYELEGGYKPRPGKQLDYQAVNKSMAKLSLQAELKPEYWQCQWEYVSLFNGQSPLQESDNLYKAIQLLPELLCKHGAQQVYIRPVIWNGDRGGMASGSRAIFHHTARDIHIPNAVQLNLSLIDSHGNNLMADGPLAEQIQCKLLETSYHYCALFLPEEEAFERIRLKSHYGLDQELSSPVNLSGGHQGSIALYRQWGKHNQPMGVETTLLDCEQQPLVTRQDWRRGARIEHRLGASSPHYNPYLNSVFALANVVDVLAERQHGTMPAKRCSEQQADAKPLPHALYDSSLGEFPGPSALALLQQDDWLETILWRIQSHRKPETEYNDIGAALKQELMASFTRRQPIGDATANLASINGNPTETI
ncbi:hypothetical protein ACFSJ3_17020 [Corallincola platygyrae]|uniref:Uncharacterized protein n=1 Tax=Corallincola platygyrae TaxID=1193278 RepID=A0ABW4XS67_9GAMM